MAGQACLYPAWSERPNTARVVPKNYTLSRIMSKPAFCICQNKGADQLCSNCTADQRLCLHHKDRTIPLLPTYKFQASNHLLLLYSLVCVRPGRKPRRQVFLRPSSCLKFQVSSYLLWLNRLVCVQPGQKHQTQLRLCRS